LQKLKDSRNTRFCRSGKQNITPKFFCRNLTQIPNVETKEKTKYQNKTIAETKQKYQIAEADTKLQKLKRR